MWLELTIASHVLSLPTWAFGVIVGVGVAWWRWRGPRIRLCRRRPFLKWGWP